MMADEERRLIEAAQRGEVESFKALVRLYEGRVYNLCYRMLGDADKGTAFFTLAIFENRYAKQNDIWRIREMRIFPLMKTEYVQGWAKSQVFDPPPDRDHAPDHSVLRSDVMKPGAIPEFFAANPATGKPVSLPADATIVGNERWLPALPANRPAAPSGDSARGR